MANRLASDIQANKDMVKGYFFKEVDGYPEFVDKYAKEKVDKAYAAKQAVLEVVQGRTGRFDAQKAATSYAADLALWKALVPEIDWISFIGEFEITKVPSRGIGSIKQRINAEFEVLLSLARGMQEYSGVVEVLVSWVEMKPTSGGMLLRYTPKEG